MTDCVVNIELRVPSAGGEDVPASGYIEFSPTKRRDLEDYIVLPDDFRVRLDDDGKATVDLAPTVEGDWAWEATERVRRGRRLYLAVPEGPGPIDYDDLVEIDPATLNPAAPIPPIWKGYVDQADAHLQEQIDEIEGSDVNTVAGVSPDDDGEIPSAGLKTALALPADTAAAIAANAQDITDEVLRAGGIESGLRTDVNQNAQDIVDETTRAQGVEGGLRTDVDAAQAALTDKADLVGGLVPTAQIPAIAIGTGQAVANRAAMLALTNVQQGDFVSITATADKGTYILNDPDPSIFGHWMPLSVPTDVVQSVNGQSGPVVLSKADIGLPLADNTSDATKPVSAAQAAAIAAAIAALAKSTDGSFSLAAPTGVGLEFVITANGLDDIRFNGTSL